MQNKKFYLEVSRKYKYKMLWTISSHCNFNCVYCYNAKEILDNFITKIYTPEHIAESFNKTGKSWLIFFLGGEPFLMPDFLPLMHELTKKHHIQISTNLCSDNVFKFPDYVPTDRVMLLSASFHVLEREKVDPDFSKYIEKYHFLKDHGYNIIGNYVTYPPLFNRIEKDFEYLHKHGVEKIMPIPYRGEFEGKHYPYEYSDQQLEIIARLADLKKSEVNFPWPQTTKKGIICEAGHRYFTMDNFGNVIQCFSVKKSFGNLFEGTFIPNKRNTKCMSGSEEWYDCYLGKIRTNVFDKIGAFLHNK
ncbi:MAG TPA: radical SAM protein [Bacteroidales bacterium]|jgi:MoaA/NifB/PqqE/SkfB family radical SAM enzyme|nr:radical SAM protein [Bacteroidales bacterium]MDD4236432.1 radical SAM protein [Bacteroidales bacterium]MDY0160968.1 radical SAM protein [Bacteroidales bacterium]MDY0322847.1 radical SAM protein [Candidatus Carbobacillus sp.]HXK82478.1 radical SAM protein [Bacteroidales bacterium]